MEIVSLARFIVIQTIVFKILPSHAQSPPLPSLSQYLHLAGFGPQASPLPVAPPGSSPSYASPSYGVPLSYQAPTYPNAPSYQTAPNFQSLPRAPPVSEPPPLPLSAITNLAASIPVPKPASQKAPVVPTISDILPAAGLDSNVLNNLAIALQLLIVSNILNMPPVETREPIKLELPKLEIIPAYESIPVSPLTLSYPVQTTVPYLQPSISYLDSPIPQSLYSYDSQKLPNVNFLGTSGFTEPAVFGSAVSARPNPRSSMTLMSPYEALGPSSPFSDPILSSVYSPSYSKKDFQSPYASILAADGQRDLFSFTDLF